VKNQGKMRKRFKKTCLLADVNAYYKNTYQIVINLYREMKETSYSTSCEALYETLGTHLQGISTGGTDRVGRVVATMSDLVSDVELAVKSICTAKEYEDFLDDAPLEEALQIKIGMELERRGMDVLSVYFKPKDVA
jgi:adenylosuccinate synthase